MRHIDGRREREAAWAHGPVNAVIIAMGRIVGYDVHLTDFRVRNVTDGEDALGEATVEVEHKGKRWRGRGVSTDSIEASAHAFLHAINRIALSEQRERLQKAEVAPTDVPAEENLAKAVRG